MSFNLEYAILILCVCMFLGQSSTKYRTCFGRVVPHFTFFCGERLWMHCVLVIFTDGNRGVALLRCVARLVSRVLAA